MTKLLYLEDFDVTEAAAKVLRVEEFEGKTVVVLDQTCFYPKGGGQDFDTGIIKSEEATFAVEAVFFVDGDVKHIGSFSTGSFAADTDVNCVVDKGRRLLNTKLHSAGHVIDMAVRSLSWDWQPRKGAHYPHMSFVEYAITETPADKETLLLELQTRITELIEKGSTNTIAFLAPEEMTEKGAVVPENLPKDKPSRAMLYDDFAVPCGGTHVKNITDIGAITVTKIKNRKPDWRVSYQIS